MSALSFWRLNDEEVHDLLRIFKIAGIKTNTNGVSELVIDDHRENRYTLFFLTSKVVYQELTRKHRWVPKVLLRSRILLLQFFL